MAIIICVQTVKPSMSCISASACARLAATLVASSPYSPTRMFAARQMSISSMRAFTTTGETEIYLVGLEQSVSALAPNPHSEPHKRVLAVLAKLNADAKVQWERFRAGAQFLKISQTGLYARSSQ